MSITFSDLEVNTTSMRESYSSVFTDGYDAERLAGLKKTVAKDRLKRDCQRIFRLDPSESSDLALLDEITDKYSESFKRALMYLQCYFYFTDYDDTDGVNAKRMKECMAAYQEELAEFGNFSSGARATSAMAIVTRG